MGSKNWKVNMCYPGTGLSEWKQLIYISNIYNHVLIHANLKKGKFSHLMYDEEVEMDNVI